MENNPYYGVEGDEWQERFDASFPLPPPGENEMLDSLCARKRISTDDLLRVGARWNPAEPHVLQVFWPRGVRYRDLVTGRRWVDPTSEWAQPKIVPPTKRREGNNLVIVEGETDAARMTSKDGPGWDVLVMGGTNQPVDPDLGGYECIYIATDSDAPGDKAAQRIQRDYPEAIRWRPPEGSDWCDLEKLPDPPGAEREMPLVVWGQDLFDLEYPDIPSHLENALLPITGMLEIHGWKNSFKSWMAFDLMVQLSIGGRWAGFETTHPELRVMAIQFEVPPPYYKDRITILYERLNAEDKEKFNKNFAHYSPLILPRWDISNEKQNYFVVDLCLKNNIDVVLFDPIRQMVGVESMNEQVVQQRLVALFRTLNAAGIAVVFVHHDSKTGARAGGGSTLDQTAGDVLVGAADSVVSVQLPKGDDLDTSKRRNLRFVVRSAPQVSPRGVRIHEDRLEYTAEAFAAEEEEPDEKVEI